MATTLPPVEATFAEESLSRPRTVRRRSRGMGLFGWFVGLVILIAIVGVAVAASQGLIGGNGKDPDAGRLTTKVVKGPLIVTVTEDGNMESGQNKDVKCEVAGGTTIKWIVDDGKQVEEGEEIIRLDDASLYDQVNTQKITYEKAQASKIQAENDFSAAEIAVTEYLEGTFVKDLQTCAANITVAMQNLKSAENSYEHAKKMFAKRFVTSLNLEAQGFAVERAKIDLEIAETAKKVLVDFTKAKMLEDLESKRDASAAKMRAEDAAFQLEDSKLKRLQGNLDKCVIKAPQSGMVVYANDQSQMMRGGGQGGTSIIELGATVREGQNMIRLPDLSQMQVKVLIHETKVESLRQGMRAKIKIQDRTVQGTVTTIASQPEQTNWFAPNVKQYATRVKIDGEQKGLKPGMTASVEVLVANLEDVLSIPVQSIVEQGGQFVCWVKTATGAEKRPLVLGLANATHVEIKDGLLEGDVVLLNPRATLPEAREDVEEAKPIDPNKEFGESSATQTTSGAPGGQAGSSGAAEAGGPGAGGPGRGPGGAGPGGPAAGGPGAGGPGAGGPGGGGRSMDLMQYDKDGDKKITKEEAPEQMQGFFDRLDTNADGAIDEAEIKAMMERFRAMQQQGGGAGFGGPPGG